MASIKRTSRINNRLQFIANRCRSKSEQRHSRSTATFSIVFRRLLLYSCMFYGCGWVDSTIHRASTASALEIVARRIRNECATMTESKIAEFYRGRCVLITGATGLTGKVLVEKLLRSCPEIERIFLLTRPTTCNNNNERNDSQCSRKEIFHDEVTGSQNRI